MATAYKNLVKHLRLALQQMEQLTKMESEIEVCDLMTKLSDLLMKLLE